VDFTPGLLKCVVQVEQQPFALVPDCLGVDLSPRMLQREEPNSQRSQRILVALSSLRFLEQFGHGIMVRDYECQGN
jgi:hypothetical protein